MDTGVGVVLLLLLGAVALYLYFLPTVIANRADHASAGAIFALNLLVGWTFIGWVVALVWALNSGPSKVAVVSETPGPGDVSADMRACPFCAEPIRAAAIKCKHCGSDLIARPADLVR